MKIFIDTETSEAIIREIAIFLYIKQKKEKFGKYSN